MTDTNIAELLAAAGKAPKGPYYIHQHQPGDYTLQQNKQYKLDGGLIGVGYDSWDDPHDKWPRCVAEYFAHLDPQTIESFCRRLLAAEAVVKATKKANVEIGATGVPRNADGKYDKNGEWEFTSACHNPEDAKCIKQAFELIRHALASYEEVKGK